MISKKDIVSLLEKKNIELDTYHRKKNYKSNNKPYIVRIQELLNDTLLQGTNEVFIRRNTFYKYLGTRYYNNVFKNKNSNNNILDNFLTLVKKGYFIRDKAKYDISVYKIDDNLIELYKERLQEIENKKFLDKKYKAELKRQEDKKRDRIVVDTVKMEFNKEELNSFFINNAKYYQIDTIREREPYRTKQSIHDEMLSFISAYAYFHKYLKSRNKYIEVEYTQSSSGRYFSFLGLLDKRIRKPILKDYISIDLDAAAPNALYETYKSLTGKELKYINEIIHSKQGVRSYIGELLFRCNKDIPKEIKIKYSKKFITALFFGSKAYKDGVNATNEIIQEVIEIQGETDKDFKELEYYFTKNDFYANEHIRAIIKEVDTLMNTVDEYLQSVTDENNIMSINGNKIDATPKKKGKKRKNTRLSYYYLNWESEYLNEEIKVLDKLEITKNYMKLHDEILIHKNELKKRNLTEQDIREKFHKIRINGNPFDIEPLILK